MRQWKRDAAGAEENEQRDPQAVIAEERRQQQPGDEIDEHRQQHHVAHVARPGGADEDAVHLEGERADDRSERRPDEVVARRLRAPPALVVIRSMIAGPASEEAG